MNDEFLTKLTNIIQQTSKQIIEEANLKQTEEIKNHIERVEGEVTELKAKLEAELNQKYTTLECKYNQLKSKYEKLEKDLRHNNIIIFGLNYEQDNLPQFVVDNLNKLLKIQLVIGDLNNTYTIGKQTQNRPIIVKLVSYLKKQEILRNCKHLRGTNIGISEELTLEERQENKILRQHLKEARKQNLDATIRNKKLIVNGEEYTVQQLAANEEETNSDEEKEEAERNHRSTQQFTSSKSQDSEVKEQEVFVTEEVKDLHKRKVSASESAPKLRSSARANKVEYKLKNQVFNTDNHTPK